MNKPIDITGGVDTHKDNHVAAALDPLGGILGTETFPATRKVTRHCCRGSGPSGRSCPSVLKEPAHGAPD